MKTVSAITLLFALLLSISVAPQSFTAYGQADSSSMRKRDETVGRTDMTTQAGNGQLDKKKRESSSEKLFREARKSFQKGRYPEAANLYMSLVFRDSTDLEARQNAAYAYLKDQNFQKCYDQANEVLRGNPNSARA